jgi:hypothetical protein
MTSQKESLEELKLFISKLMNEEQDRHSKTAEQIRSYLGLNLGQDTIKVINEVYKARVEILNKVYDKIQELK